MVIETRDNIVFLSGSLIANQWPTVKTAIHLLLKSAKQGIIIDCAELQMISAEGADTFVDALREIEAKGLPIVVARMPESLQARLEGLAHGRSDAYTAETVEAARITQATSSPLWWQRLWGIPS